MQASEIEFGLGRMFVWQSGEWLSHLNKKSPKLHILAVLFLKIAIIMIIFDKNCITTFTYTYKLLGRYFIFHLFLLQAHNIIYKSYWLEHWDFVLSMIWSSWLAIRRCHQIIGLMVVPAMLLVYSVICIFHWSWWQWQSHFGIVNPFLSVIILWMVLCGSWKCFHWCRMMVLMMMMRIALKIEK